MVQRSIEMGQPVIFVALNYRLHGKSSAMRHMVPHRPSVLIPPPLAFGFLGGQEVKDAGIGNIGLHDRASPYFVLSSSAHAYLPRFLRGPKNVKVSGGLKSTSVDSAETRTKSRCTLFPHQLCPAYSIFIRAAQF